MKSESALIQVNEQLKFYYPTFRYLSKAIVNANNQLDMASYRAFRPHPTHTDRHSRRSVNNGQDSVAACVFVCGVTQQQPHNVLNEVMVGFLEQQTGLKIFSKMTKVPAKLYLFGKLFRRSESRK